jgi:hypothetical protein
MTDTPATPKAFISYSWSTLDHQQWVIDLASRLIEDGVEVELDKWDLKEGGDKFAFMERMVTDPTVTKVLIVCDRIYKEKADGREGGVGTESTILTPELYGKKSPNKFAALVVEKDEDGEAFTPAFWAGRIYIDFADPSHFEDRYEQLLRWCLDKPLHVKPRLGKVPDFITAPALHASATLSRFKRADAALREGKPNAPGLIIEYGESLVAELRRHTPKYDEHPFADEAVIACIEAVRPYGRQLAELEASVIRYADGSFDRLIALHEQLGRLMYRDDSLMQWRESDYDPFEFFAYEAFLRFVATLLDAGRYDLVGRALDHAYFIDEPNRGGRPSTASYAIFGRYVKVFEARKNRLRSDRIDPMADMVFEGNQKAVPSFEQIMEADFLLAVRSQMAGQAGRSERWYPRTLIYASRSWKAFPLFARSESAAFFARWSTDILHGVSIEAFKQGIATMEQGMGAFANYNGLGAPLLANVEFIGTKP